jgi:hypothetical protein
MESTTDTSRVGYTPGSVLFAALTEGFPAPWKIEFHAMKPHYKRPHVAAIIAADGTNPITLETHSGDGDMFYLGDDGAEALAAFVNAMHEQAWPNKRSSDTSEVSCL